MDKRLHLAEVVFNQYCESPSMTGSILNLMKKFVEKREKIIRIQLVFFPETYSETS